MDAYDIFKKLTKGLSFKYRVLGVKNNVSIQNNLQEYMIIVLKLIMQFFLSMARNSQ